MPPAAPTRPGDVIDAHTHLFTVGLLEEMLSHQPPEAMKRWRDALKTGKWGRPGREQSLPDMTPAECARWYTERINEAGVSRAVVMSTFGGAEWTAEFLAAANGHVLALAGVDPRDPEAPAQLERDIAAGFKGVKLYPVNRCYRVSDPACRPFFEKVAELGVPVTVHYGVTVDPTGDMRFADPTDLSPVARDFPDTPFVIAHFGAGFLPEVLRVAYQCKNVCVDSSGTNNWMDYFVPRMTLADVFERCLASIGPQRIMFGTDSGTTAPYREWIKFQQTRVLEELGLSDHERDLILRANAVRIFNLG
jgi:predicted TIM-barrel fold metal-dependent hydrolase